MQPLSSPWDSIQQFGHCLFKLPKNTAGFGPDAGKASVTGMQQGQMLRHSSDHTGSGFYHLSSQQAAALPGSSPVNNRFRGLPAIPDHRLWKEHRKEFFPDFHARRSFTTAQGNKAFNIHHRLPSYPAVLGFHQSSSPEFRLLITVFTVGVSLIGRMTVLALLKHDIIP